MIFMAKKKQDVAKPAANVSKEEQIGFHKGALSTLAKEREEMMRILQIVEQLMQMHIKGLKDLGIRTKKIKCPPPPRPCIASVLFPSCLRPWPP